MSKGWKNGRVGELIASLESGISVNGEDGTPSNDDYAVLKVSAVTYGKFNPQASKKITGSELQRAKCTPKKGQIIISRSNSPDLVGASCYVSEDYPNRFLPDKLWQTVPHPEKKVEHKWLAYFLASPWARFRLSKLATGTSNSMKNITKSELLTLPVPIPPIHEQNKIAEMLDLWDNAIEKTEALIVAKEKQFKSILQLLMVPKTYWESCKFKDILVERIERQGKSDFVISSVGINGLRNRDEIYSKELAKDYLKNKVVRKNDIAFGLASDSIVYGINTQTMVCSVSPAYKVFNIVHCNVDFLGYYLKAANRRLSQKYLIISARQGKSIDFQGFLNQAFFFPSCKEQNEIAHVLNLGKQEIALLKKVLEQYRIQKRGLMQKLLTGKWQVNSTQAVVGDMYQELSKERTA